MRLDASPHALLTLDTWEHLQNLKEGGEKIILDGNTLDIASVVAVARYGVKAEIVKDEELVRRINLSVDALAEYLSHKYVVYGVNTGFGGVQMFGLTTGWRTRSVFFSIRRVP
ncbi:hypothetical protein NXS19_014001 [Fusarium pseudograminearum]|nr:hypothetical protein NXS19_014001 [Fusarium pseudograminearum]